MNKEVDEQEGFAFSAVLTALKTTQEKLKREKSSLIEGYEGVLLQRPALVDLVNKSLGEVVHVVEDMQHPVKAIGLAMLYMMYQKGVWEASRLRPMPVDAMVCLYLHDVYTGLDTEDNKLAQEVIKEVANVKGTGL